MFYPSIALLACVVFAPSPHHTFGLTESMPRMDNTIRVASYNLMNFFDQVDDPALSGEFDDIGNNPGPTSLERCEELAKTIRELDADVLTLQEVESLTALQWFNTHYLQEMRYNYIASEEVGYYRGIEQSVLSRLPISEIITWQDADLTDVTRTGIDWTPVPENTDEIKFQRSPLCVTVTDPSGYSLTLFVLHHKAGRSNQWHREAEALQIVEYVESMMRENPSRNIIVLGDFNAAPWDRSVRTYLGAGLIDTMAHRSVNKKYNDDAPLWKTHTSGRIIDYILLNPAAMGEFAVGSGFILGTSAEDYDWRNVRPPAGYASDHYPIAIDLIPQEGQGVTVQVPPWPDRATITALSTIEVTEQPTSKTIPIEGAPFVASKKSKVFHDSGCNNAARIKDTNMVGYETIEDAASAGKRPAKCCNPTE